MPPQNDDSPTYRVDAYTKWKRLPPNRTIITGCIRCSRQAEFLREKYKNKKGAETYDLAGFCAKHTPESVITAVDKTGPAQEKPHAATE